MLKNKEVCYSWVRGTHRVGSVWCVLKSSQCCCQDCWRKDAANSWQTVSKCWHPPLLNPSGRAHTDRVDQGHCNLWCITYRRVVKCNVLFTGSVFPNLMGSQLSTGRDSADRETTAACFSQWVAVMWGCVYGWGRYRWRRISAKIAADNPPLGLPHFSCNAPGGGIFKQLAL